MRNLRVINIVILFCLVTTSCYAACTQDSAHVWTAASAEVADVQECIDGAADDGDTINIPADTKTWSTKLIINNKQLILAGAGKAATIITDGTTPAYNVGMVYITGTKTFEIKDIWFKDVKSGSTGILIYNSYSGEDWKIHDCKFSGKVTFPYSTGVYVNGSKNTGVIYGNEFIDSKVDVNHASDTYDSDLSWTTATNLGGADATYVENNTFTRTYTRESEGNAVDCNGGGRVVMRYNDVEKSHFYSHTFGTVRRGCRKFEVYNNKFTTAGTSWAGAHSGTGVLYNNQLYGTMADYNIKVSYKRAAGTCTDCSGTWATYPVCAVGQATDYDNPTTGGYPCRDELGRGVDTGITTAQALDPAYQWNNMKCTTSDPASCTVDIDTLGGWTDTSTILALSTDYYNDVKNYTAYECPHPLVGAGSCTANVAGTLGYSLGGEAPTKTLTVALSGTGADMSTGELTVLTGGSSTISVTRHNGWNGAWSTSDGTNCVVSECAVPDQGATGSCSVTVNADCTVTYTATQIQVIW